MQNHVELTKKPFPLPRQKCLILPTLRVLEILKFVIDSLSNHVEMPLCTQPQGKHLELELDVVVRCDKMCLPLGTSECI